MTREQLPLSAEEVASRPLPAHHPQCFGCGPDNRHGLKIGWRQDGDAVRAAVVLDERHQGSPGLAHGGVIAAISDEAAGALLLPLKLPAVTARLEVLYRHPVRLREPLHVESWLDRRDGRKLEIKVEFTAGGTVRAQADVLFIAVAPEHFHNHGSQPGELAVLGI